MPGALVGSSGPARRLAGGTLIAAGAAAAGAASAWTAYRFGPAAFPLAIAAGAAVMLGLWRIELGLALLLFLTPFSENADLSNPGQAKLRLALIGWACLLVLIEIGRLARSEEPLDAPPIVWAALAFLAAALVSVAVAVDDSVAAGKFLMLSGSVVVFALITLTVRDWRRLEIVMAGGVLAGLVVAAHAIFQYLTGDFSRIGFIDGSGTVEYRVTSFFSHPNQLAGFLAVLIPVAAALARHATMRPLRVAAAALVPLALVAVVLTYSRGALVGLLALPLIMVRNPRTWPLLAVALVAIALVTPGVWRARIADAGSLQSPEIATRVEIWAAAIEGFGQRPVLGWGLNNFPQAYIALERPGRNFLGAGGFDVPPTAHNLYLNVAVEQGLVGVMALVLLGIAVVQMTIRLRRSEDRRRRAMGLALLGSATVIALHNLFDVTFVDPKTSVLTWSLFGVGAALLRPDPAEPGRADP
jgi:putative inorganic carbon (HCO3(-)) transporter